MCEFPNCLQRLILSKEDAAKRMNVLGKRGAAFFFMTDFEASHCIVEPVSELPESDIMFDFPGISHRVPVSTAVPENFRWRAMPESFDSYGRSFEIVRKNIFKGNSFLTNLTCATDVETDLSLLQVFEHSESIYRLWIRDCFTVFSPETFVKISDGHIFSFPMKGTIDATLPDAESVLLGDPKETAEHATITDLIRNDLSMFASDVQVVRFRYLDRLQTNRGALLQMSSEIRGKLSPDYKSHIGDILFGMLPAGSISGAPKKKTVEIIKQAEHYSRGFYTGVMGYFDGENLDSAVMIRFIEQEPDGRIVFKSGGGITFMSDARKEYEEMIEKIYVPVY